MLSSFFGFRGLGDVFSPFGAGPVANAREGAKGVLIELEVPGYRREDVTVEIDAGAGLITVSGKRGASTHADDAGFDHILYASSPLSSFRRHYRLSPAHYQFDKVAWTVENGLLRVEVPKKELPPPPKPVVVYDGATRAAPAIGDAPAASSTAVAAPATSGAVVVGSADQMAAFRKAAASWPPTVKIDEAANALTYKCQLPAGVAGDQVKLELIGRALVLSVTCSFRRKTGNSEDSEMATYSTSFAVPAGTTPEQIHTTIQDGVLTISLDKNALPGAVGVSAGAKA